MAILALTFAVVAFQVVESKIEKQMAPFSYKSRSVEKLSDGVRLTLLREMPVYNSGAQGAGGQQGNSESAPPKPTSFLRDEAFFLLLSEAKKPAWSASKNHSTTQDAFLGKLDGKYVYAQGPIGELAYVAKTLPFQGGEDWRAIAIRGIESQGPNYRGVTSELFFNSTGDSSLPFLQKALSSKPKNAWGLIRAVGETSGPGSIPMLQKLYRNKDEKISRAAAYALVSSPRRAEARKELLDMLERGIYVQYAAETAAKNSWIEAIPILQKVKVEKNRFRDLVAVMEAERTLRPSTIHVLKVAYAQILQGQDEEAKFMQMLIEDPDKEMSAAYALALRGTVAKADTSKITQAGQTILDMLPKQAIEAVRLRFKQEEGG